MKCKCVDGFDDEVDACRSESERLGLLPIVRRIACGTKDKRPASSFSNDRGPRTKVTIRSSFEVLRTSQIKLLDCTTAASVSEQALK